MALLLKRGEHGWQSAVAAHLYAYGQAYIVRNPDGSVRVLDPATYVIRRAGEACAYCEADAERAEKFIEQQNLRERYDLFKARYRRGEHG